MGVAEPLLVAADIRLALGGNQVLEGASLAVSPGQVTALVGPNGAGKSTLIRVLAGLQQPDAGKVELLGRAIDAYPARQLGQHLTLVPQDTRTDAEFTVADFVSMGRYPHLGRFKLPTDTDRRVVKAAMDAVAVRELRRRYVPTLSGGERQRVYLARAWATQAQVILLDEPTANLDVRHALQLHDALAHLVGDDASRGALVVLHEINDALRFAHRVAVMHEGAIVAEGSPSETLDATLLRRVFGVLAEPVTTPDGSIHLHFTAEG